MASGTRGRPFPPAVSLAFEGDGDAFEDVAGRFNSLSIWRRCTSSWAVRLSICCFSSSDIFRVTGMLRVIIFTLSNKLASLLFLISLSSLIYLFCFLS